jgi:hypothetical protein
MKQTIPIIHLYIPEALDHSNCEIWYFKHLFQRRLTKAKLKYYAYPNRKEFETAFDQTKKHSKRRHDGKKGDTIAADDLFFIVTDTDLKPGQSNRDEVRADLRKHYNWFNGDVPIIFSSRSFETWLCMHNQVYNKPFSGQNTLEHDVGHNYEKTEKWYKTHAERLYSTIDNACANCRISRSSAIDSEKHEHTNRESFKNTVPTLADEYTINWFLNISTITYMDKLIDVLRGFE